MGNECLGASRIERIVRIVRFSDLVVSWFSYFEQSELLKN